MHTALPWTLFLIGVFYALGGVVLVRQMAMDTLLDKAIAAITLKRDRVEEAATHVLTAGAWLTLASGLVLMAQSRAALVIFGLNIAVQAGYLIWAARARPPESEPERKGRRATVNALFIYVGVFGLVLLMEQQGLWREWLGSGLAGLGAEIVAAMGVTAALVWLIWNPPGAKRQGAFGRDDDSGDDLPAHDPGRVPRCLRLAPEHQCWPLWDDETGSSVNPEILGLSEALMARIAAWDTLFQKGYRDDDPLSSGFVDVTEERLWADEGEAVWEVLCEEWEGDLCNRTSQLQYLMNLAFDGVNTFDLPPPAKVAEMAAQCGVVEIREMLRRLDTLADEWRRIEAWDGDSQDDVARLQSFYARVLAQVAPRYREDVAAGLTRDEETRRWVQLALDGQAG